ncbi:hypothetical protein L1987_43013 [Smallanthus sonchifolius]|uniref:Uncharacterized protein n=1 Tax=Smallanthus sonchifolius TaxID=185202 RepID=A0ACB9GKD1_9ASTR|nr:hypothetical protein L1987_43013 [Smallanthus sonchifolius]
MTIERTFNLEGNKRKERRIQCKMVWETTSRITPSRNRFAEAKTAENKEGCKPKAKNRAYNVTQREAKEIEGKE